MRLFSGKGQSAPTANALRERLSAGHIPVFLAALLTVLSACVQPVLGYEFNITPTTISVRTNGEDMPQNFGKSDTTPTVIPVGGSLGILMSIGKYVVFAPTEEYTYGYCGYGYDWTLCIANPKECTHGAEHLDENACDISHSYYFRFKEDTPETGYTYESPQSSELYIGSSMVAGNQGARTLAPGPHSLRFEMHSAYCIHRSGQMGIGQCHELVSYGDEAVRPVKVVRVASIGGPANFSTSKVNSTEPGFMPGFQDIDRLCIPVGAAGQTAVFTATSHPAGEWPADTPSWSLAGRAGVLSVSPPNSQTATVAIDNAFSGELRAGCGTSYVALRLNVVEVSTLSAAICDTATGLDTFWDQENGYGCTEDCLPGEAFVETADGQALFLDCQEKWLTVLAQPNPVLADSVSAAEALLPSGENGWQFTGGEAATPKMVRKLDLTQAGVTQFHATCGASEKRLDVHVAGVNIRGDVNHDGVVSQADDARLPGQNGAPGPELETTVPGVVLTLPSPNENEEEKQARFVPLHLITEGLAALEALPENQTENEEEKPRLTLSYDSAQLKIYRALNDNNSLIEPGVTKLPFQDGTTTVYAQAVAVPTPQPRTTVTLVFNSLQYSFSDSLLVTVLDINPSMANGGHLLVNDDNDDMLAYSETATEADRRRPANTEKDLDQTTEMSVPDDDLQNATFPFAIQALGDFAQQCSVSFSLDTGLCLYSNNKKKHAIQAGQDYTACLGTNGLQVGTAPALLNASNSALTVAVEGTQKSSALFDKRLVATWKINQQELRAILPLTVYQMQMLVDGGKHEQNINFEDFGSDSEADFGNYRCVFWANTDNDTIHYEERSWHEDDNSGYFSGAGTPNCMDDRIGGRGYRTRRQHSHNGGTQAVHIPPADSENHCLRDLEDFNRLQIRLDPLFAQLDNVTFSLSGAPVNIFKAFCTNLDYLSKPQEAQKQVVERKIAVINNEVPLPASLLKFDGESIPFIWEGCATCDADLLLVARLPSGQEIGRKKVRIVIYDISSFFDTWEWNTIPGGTFLRPEVCASLGQTANDYILFVHGFNVSNSEKATWPATAYKRVWWQGYKGRLGIFSWPCETFPSWRMLIHLPSNIYDNSDYMAHNCSTHLASLLVHLEDGYCHGKVHMLAHSQGNIVAGEALRVLAGRTIHTFIATQAAISISNFQSVNLPYFEESDYKKSGLTHLTPDVRAAFPGCQQPAPYMTPVTCGNRAEGLYNFYNEDDYALRACSFFSWEDDNQ
ncbi:MAG: alpha/beta hydrolase, partial [Victivallales bacterium]|nr:alpha/beta hydrolase [Victivallales bacterium]